jgi:hypothetical protein
MNKRTSIKEHLGSHFFRKMNFAKITFLKNEIAAAV